MSRCPWSSRSSRCGVQQGLGGSARTTVVTAAFVSVLVSMLAGCGDDTTGQIRPGRPIHPPVISDPATYPVTARVVGDPTQPRPAGQEPDFTTNAFLRDRTVVLTQYGSSSCPPTVLDAFVVAADASTGPWLQVKTDTHLNEMCTADMGPHVTEVDIPRGVPLPTQVRNDAWTSSVTVTTHPVVR